ncbi:uncharacterized protein [Asterias amurensis]|uniref:uncharacterized protein n=1 Tax=Asterias amurensis TaxID=7602 RepID=UPI003AB67756
MAPANSTDLMTTTIGGGSELTTENKIAISAVSVVAIGVFVAILTCLGYHRKPGTGTFLCCRKKTNTEESTQPQEEGQQMMPTTIPQPTEDIGHDHRQDRVSQQPSNVHTVRPNQPPAEVQNVSFGDRSVGFLGHTSGVTVNQNTIQNVTGTPDQE